MKIHFIFFTIVFICFFNTAKGQVELIHNDWVKEDSLFIGSVTQAYKISPLQVEEVLFSDHKKYSVNISEKLKRKVKLGFDYYYLEGSSGKGYVSIFYKLIYCKDKLVGYELHPQLPGDPRLLDRYLKFYSQLFGISKNKQPELLYYGYDEVSKPFNDYKGTASEDIEIQFFMSPYSGIYYAKYGGDPIHLLPKWLYFEKIKGRITAEICELLMYSKNPSTRLFAIEFYYKNQQLFKKNKEQVENRIEMIYNELPEIGTYYADVYGYENAKVLVDKFVKE